MSPDAFKVLFLLIAAACGYLLARHNNSVDHWGNIVVGVCLVSLGVMALNKDDVKKQPQSIDVAGLTAGEIRAVQNAVFDMVERKTENRNATGTSKKSAKGSSLPRKVNQGRNQLIGDVASSAR